MADNQKSILVIDDDPMIIHIVKSILEVEGYTIHAASSGDEAIQNYCFSETPPKIDLILCDWNMPGRSGTDVLGQMKLTPSTQNIPFMFLTAENSNEQMMTGYSLGTDYYLTKPFTRQQLIYAVNLAFEKPKSGES